MPGYEKGTTPEGEMVHLQEAFARATAAIRAQPQGADMWRYANDLAELVKKLGVDAADFRGWIAAFLHDYHHVTLEELAAFMGVTRARAHQLVTRGREKGYPVTEPTTLPEQPHVALAIITSEQGVLVAKRTDGIPPWTFLGGEIQPGESSGDALKRRVEAEAGLKVTDIHFIGRRIHPKTSRVMVYAHVAVAPGEPELGDPEDLSEVKWVTVDDTRDLMPDMYGPVRQYLDDWQRI
jgi:8-oxo-dGTP diphosphatase